MTLQQAILDAVRELPADKQRDLLDHVKRLRDEAMQPQKPRAPGSAELCRVKNSLNLTFRFVYSYIMDTTAKRMQLSPSCPRLSSYLSSRLYW
jgi:hypothetical protein